MDLHVWRDAVPPICVARPASAAEVTEVVRLSAAAGACIVPRGAGLSYTAGTVCGMPHITIDTTRIDHIDIHADDLYAVVGAGCNWAALDGALKPHDLRVQLAAPVSGNVSTIGGALSQNVAGPTDAVLGLQIVLASGEQLTTGSAALHGRSPFYRGAGPDLTGLFLGDCGAFGIKTEIVLRLSPRPHLAMASFAFADPVALVEAIAQVQHTGNGAACVALDPKRSADTMRSVGLAEATRTGLAMLRRGHSPLALLGARIRPGKDWSLHVTVESASRAGAAAQLAALRRQVVSRGGVEIAASIPAAMQARPFSVRGALGPAAERWVPVHGLLPLSAAPEAMRALLAYADATASERQEAGIAIGWLLSSKQGHILIEPMLLWRDALGTQHLRHLPPRVTARAAERPKETGTRAVVDRMRAELRDVLDEHGAVHLQIGRYYQHAEALAPATRALLATLKDALDPARRLNPGSAGL